MLLAVNLFLRVHGRHLHLFRRFAVGTYARPAVLPYDLVEEELAAAVAAVRSGVAVIEYPILSGIVGYDLRVMARAYDLVAVLEQHLVLVLEHLVTLFVNIWSEERFAASYVRLVGAVAPCAACSRRGS